MHDSNIESLLTERRVFKPSKEFAAKARIKSLGQYRRMYRESIKRPAKFWAREAKELTCQRPWERVLIRTAPFAQWFVGVQLNGYDTCLVPHPLTDHLN